MKIPVLIEPVPGNGYRARGIEPFAEVGEGTTPDEALEKLKESLQRRFSSGARLASLDISAAEHVWLPFAGIFQEEDPIVQTWLEIMKAQREEDEAAE